MACELVVLHEVGLETRLDKRNEGGVVAPKHLPEHPLAERPHVGLVYLFS